MSTKDDLDMIRGLLAERGPSASVTDRGRARLDVLAAAEPGSRPFRLCSAAGRSPRTGWPPARKGLVAAAATMSVAAVAVAAVVVSATTPGGADRVSRRGISHPAASGPQVPLTPRQVLLTAAVRAASAPATTGRYWRVRERSGQLLPAGTREHRYDIFDWTSADTWTARAAGQRSWYIWQELPATLDAPADVAAWRAAGSPSQWAYGAVKKQKVALSAQAPGASWQVSNGTVGYIEGDEASLTAAQFAALPDSPSQLKAVLEADALKTWSAQHPGSGAATVNQLVWSEAVALLTDPVTPRVRAAAFKIMAGLPGVKSLGTIRDPLGRQGYGVGLGPSTWGTGLGEQFAVIDPGAGALLGTTLVGHPPVCLQFSKPACDVNVPGGAHLAPVHVNNYYGRKFTAATPIYWDLVVQTAWTSARPALPPAAARVRG